VTAANLHRIQRLNMGIGGALIIVAALLRPRSEALGVAVGVALTCLNFFLLTRIITKWTADVAAGRPSPTSLLMVPKMTGLMVLVVLALWLLPISAPAFAVGFSVFVVSIIVEAVYSTVAAPATADAANPTPPSAPSA
jgi:hypothetical protein